MEDEGAGDTRRKLYFAEISDIEADVNRMMSLKCRTLGKWSFSQLLEHLARSTDCQFDGFGFQASWFVRVFVAPFVKNSALTKPLPTGVRLPKAGNVLIPDEDLPIEQSRDHLFRALARYKTEIPTAKHPFFGSLATQEWHSLTLRHAELHLSFVIPITP